MPSEPSDASGPFDVGLLAPLSAGTDGAVSDAAVLHALVASEAALVRAWVAVGVAPDDAVAGIPDGSGIDVRALAEDARGGGNPVIPLVPLLKAAATPAARGWVHRGATSQDILDSALMLVARDATARVDAHLQAAEDAIETLLGMPDAVAVARTLTQHAVPTTVSARLRTWRRGIARARGRLAAARSALPAQLGGAAGTLASFVEIAGADAARRLPAVYADELGLAAPDAPWHTTRWPVTELGDALVQTVDALGKIATDVATLSRPEIGEMVVAEAGGSSAMPQKQNPVAAVLVRSAALRAPQLGATLHLAAAFAGDERPDGAWHAEWATVRELLRLTLGAADRTAETLAGIRIDGDAVARALALSGGLVVAERLGIVLRPRIGDARFTALIAAAGDGADLDALVRALPEAADLDVGALLDPAAYTGLAGER